MSRSLNDILKTHRHICWYPSANADFRGLLYLSSRYFEWKKIPKEAGQELPDLFVMTDIRPNGIFNCPGGSFQYREKGYTDIQFLGEGRWREIKKLYCGYRMGLWTTTRQKVTEITVTHIEKLDDIELEYKAEFFSDGFLERKPLYYGNAFYIRAHVVSGQRENSPELRYYEYDSDIVYILADNTAFARDYLLKNKISSEYVIQIRYGDSMGGSAVSGNWLGMILDSLNCKYFMANPRYARSVDMTAMPETVKEFFDGYQMKPVSFNMAASFRDYRTCLYAQADDFDDIDFYRVVKHGV